MDLPKHRPKEELQGFSVLQSLHQRALAGAWARILRHANKIGSGNDLLIKVRVSIINTSVLLCL